MIPANSSISSLIDGLVREAAQAPRLFSDLAKIEKYIAESYKTRALIELLQNADDARSTEFIVESVGDGLVVANDGRAFTIADVEALCRSGASNKHRGDGTIGYRGIGFKSVVNLASRVWVFSGEQRFLFDRERTRSVLRFQDDVPLIRVPHLVETDDVTATALGLWRSKYSTVFFFEALETRLLDEEVEAFDGDCLLFLNHLERVILRIRAGGERTFVRSSHVADGRRFILLASKSADTAWEVLSENAHPMARVALKVEEERIVPAEPAQAIIHSFTPTTEYTGAPVKFNGDFTTDPSRKTVDLDSTSSTEFLRSCSILCEAVRCALERQVDRPGLFRALSPQHSGDGRLRPLFWKTMSSILAQVEVAFPGGLRGSMPSVRLRPEWLNYDDYEILSSGRWPYLDRNLLVTYPELELFLNAVGARHLALEDALGSVADDRPSMRGRAELFARCVVQFRYDCEGDRLRWLRHLPLFPTAQGFLAAEQLSESDCLDPGFLRDVAAIVESSDLAFVMKRLGLRPVHCHDVADSDGRAAVGSSTMVNQSTEVVTKPSFQRPPAIAKWRSAERNTLEYIKAMDTVLAVSDVSQANLGHDLEVTMKTGRRMFVEVKSVTSFNEPFRLTSNEYATASSAGADYVLAIVVNADQFEIRFVSDPVAALSFERRCERWSLQCSDYGSAGNDPELVFAPGRRTKE